MRKRVVFIRKHKDVGQWMPIGTRVQMLTAKADDLIEKKIVQEYTGPWPPKTKTKFNLKDLR